MPDISNGKTTDFCFYDMQKEAAKQQIHMDTSSGPAVPASGEESGSHEDWLKQDLFLSKSAFRMRLRFSGKDRDYEGRRGRTPYESMQRILCPDNLPRLSSPMMGDRMPVHGHLFYRTTCDRGCCRGCSGTASPREEIAQ